MDGDWFPPLNDGASKSTVHSGLRTARDCESPVCVESTAQSRIAQIDSAATHHIAVGAVASLRTGGGVQTKD